MDLLIGADEFLQWLAEARFSVKLAMKPDNTRLASELLTAAQGYRRASRSAAQEIAADGSVPSQILRTTNQFLLRRNHWFEVVDGRPRIAPRSLDRGAP